MADKVNFDGLDLSQSGRTKHGLGLIVGKNFGLAPVPTKQTFTLKSSAITMTHLYVAKGSREISVPLPREKAFVLSLWLTPVHNHELWKGGKLHNADVYPAGSISMVHLEEDPQGVLANPFESVHFQFPELALKELAADDQIPEFAPLWRNSYQVDPYVETLGRLLVRALRSDNPWDGLFFDHIVLAIHAHLVNRHSTARQTQWASRRLTIAQEKRAKDLLTEDLSSEPSLGRIAEALGLPPSTFRAAFRASTGQPPFRWLRQHRVETAKYLLQGKSLRLSEIAYACGFADQSHFTRVFTSHTGLTPGDWRALC